MPKKMISSFENKIAKELVRLGYYPLINYTYFDVYKIDEKGHSFKLFSIEKDTYYITIVQPTFLSLSLAKIIVRLLEHYQKMKYREYKR